MAQRWVAPSPDEIESILDEVTRRLVAAAQPEKIILFGSRARGDFDDYSDLDILVVLPVVESRHREMVRLQHEVAGVRVPIDIIVYSSAEVEQRRELRGTTLYHALQEGRVLYDAA